MSVFGSIWGGVKNVGSTIKKAAVDTGHEIGRAQNKDWVKALEAAGLAATGVGAPAAAALLGGASALGGAIAPGGNIGTAAGQGVKGAAMGYGAAKAGAALKGTGSFLDKAGAVYGAGKSALGAATGGVGGLASGVAGALTGGSGGGGGGGLGGVNPAILGLAGLQTANAASLGAKANDFADKGWNAVNDSYMSRAGLRSKGIDGLMNPVARDTSALSAIRNQNPVAARAGLPRPMVS